MMTRVRILTVMVALLSIPAGSRALQQGGLALVGSVVDSAGRPVQDVRVFVEQTQFTTQTGPDGSFELIVATGGGGDYQLALEKSGWMTQRYRFRLAGQETEVRNFGLLTLRKLPPGSVVVTGVVRDDATANTISSVAIEHNGRTVAITDSVGQFRFVAAAASAPSRLVLRRIGYETAQYFFEVPQDAPELHIDVDLSSAAIELAAIEVSETAATMATRRLAGFNRRRESARGHFFTAEEIERMNPVVTSDVVRRVPGATVRQGGAPSGIGMSPQDVAAGLTPAGTETRILLTARRSRGNFGGGSIAMCDPTYFVDGVRLSNPNIDALTAPGRLAGMEVYSSASEVPAELSTGGADCGVIAIWTKDGMFETRSPVELGAHYGGAFVNGRFTQGRVGGQLVTKLFRGLEFNPGFSVVVDVPSAGGSATYSGWQLLLNVRGRPLGAPSPWYVGGGVSVSSVQQKTIGDPLGLTGGGRTPTKASPVLFTGLSLDVAGVMPFAEFHVTDAWSPSKTQALIFSGVRFGVGRN